MIKIFNKIYYRNRILCLQNQMSSGYLVEIAACGHVENIINIYD